MLKELRGGCHERQCPRHGDRRDHRRRLRQDRLVARQRRPHASPWAADGQSGFSQPLYQLVQYPAPSLVAAKAAGAPTLNYGVFLQSVLDFLIIAFVIFMLVKQMNRLKKETAPPPPAPPVPSNEEKLLTEIRDLLKDRQ